MEIIQAAISRISNSVLVDEAFIFNKLHVDIASWSLRLERTTFRDDQKHI